MKKQQSRPKYFLYARKSTEKEDQQVRSIESQIDELKRIAEREGLKIVKVLSESKSAKTLGRPVFNDMLERIAKGEVNGILCWKLDRLARNFIDGGKIIEMLQQSTIQHIRSFERSYHPQDNVLLMSLEFGMANQFSRDLSVNVERGLRRKAELGWYPVQPPLGWLNSKIKGKGNNDIYEDPERFHLVKKMWDLMLTGTMTPPRILEIATNEWGFRARSGKKASGSQIYYMFANPFYYGTFEFPKGSGNWYRGKHKPMITEEEFDRVQILLGRKGNPRPKRHRFAFTGSMKCGECGSSITAEEKGKTQKNGNVHHYIYYHCTRSKNRNCTQKSIEEKVLKEQIMQELDKLEIPDEFYRWGLKWIEQENENEVHSRKNILSSQRKEYDAVVRKIDAFIEMRAREELTQEEFIQKKSGALKEKDRLNILLNNTDQRVAGWAENMQNAFAFVHKAKEKFATGTIDEKKQIFMALGSELLLKDKKLFIEGEKSLLAMKKLAHEVQGIHNRIETPKNVEKQGYFEEIYSQIPEMSAR